MRLSCKITSLFLFAALWINLYPNNLLIFNTINEAKAAELLTREAAMQYEGIISAGDNHTLGLTRTGQAVSAGYGDDFRNNIHDWTNITAIAVSNGHTVCLRSDSGMTVGTVLMVFNGAFLPPYLFGFP